MNKKDYLAKINQKPSAYSKKKLTERVIKHYHDKNISNLKQHLATAKPSLYLVENMYKSKQFKRFRKETSKGEMIVNRGNNNLA